MKRLLRTHVNWVSLVFATISLVTTALGQEISIFALQGPGQASVVIDQPGHVAHIIDLGRNGDGDELLLEGKPLLLALRQDHQINRLTITCSHPHADHHGGIKALMKNPANFAAADGEKFFGNEIPIIESDMNRANSLTALFNSPQNKSGVKAVPRQARQEDAYAGYSKATDAVFIESVPYTVAETAGIHGRSVVTLVTLGGKHVHLDTDDASSAVIRQVAEKLRERGVRIDSFVVPHHGSAAHDIDPVLLLRRTTEGGGPAKMTAVISVDPQNKYGHPAPEILAQLMKTLGKENVVLTGSEPEKRVRITPEGVVDAPYRASDAGIFALFVLPAMQKAKGARSAATKQAYDDILAMMSNNDGTQPPDPATVTSNRRPPKAPSGGSAAVAEQYRTNGTVMTPSFEAGNARFGLVTPAVTAASRIAEPLKQPGPVAVFAKQSAGNGAFSPVIRQLSQWRDTIESQATVMVHYLTNAGVPDVRAPVERQQTPKTPNGGMVNLRGDKLMMGPEAQVLIGGKVEKCPAGLCLATNAALTGSSGIYALPFGMSVLGAAVWDRTYRQGLDQLYLSIDPTKQMLDEESRQNRAIPTDKLHFGATLPPEWMNNRVVTQGDIEKSAIGRVLWEADVAFKSRSLGFDVLTGVRPLTAAPLDITHEQDKSLSDGAVADVSRQNRWCRMYWESGDQTISPNKATARIQLRGKAVVAHGEAMVLKAGKLESYPQGDWCEDARVVAKSLEESANAPAVTGNLKDLRSVSEMQNFWRWAREHSIIISDNVATEFGRLLEQDGKERVPTWTSGVRSTAPVLVQYERRIGAEEAQLLHVKYGDDSIATDCVAPKWAAAPTEWAALGIHPDSSGSMTAKDIYSKVDKWMLEYAETVKLCAHGKLLPAKVVTTKDIGDEEPRRGYVVPVVHREPIEIHGGILLGKTPPVLREVVKRDGRLDDPAGKPIFRQVGQDLHFWSVRHSGQHDELVEHAEILGAGVVEAYASEGVVSFLVRTTEDSVVREELRKKRSPVLGRGVEWFGIYPAPGQPAYIEKAAWPCAQGEPDCVWVEDVGRDDLDDYLRKPEEEDFDEEGPERRLIYVGAVDENLWIVKVNTNQAKIELTADDPPEDGGDGAELSATSRMLKWWGFETDGELLAGQFSQLLLKLLDSDDYIAAFLSPDLKSRDLAATTVRIARYRKKQLGEEKNRPADVLAQVGRYEKTLSQLPIARSGDAWEILVGLSAALEGEFSLKADELNRAALANRCRRMARAARALSGDD